MDDRSTWIEEDYQLLRNYQESIRLYAQDWIWRVRLGWLLDPDIAKALDDESNKAAEVVNVIDVACNNAAWLIPLAVEHPQWACTGVDVSSEPFPPACDLPANLQLRTWNAFDPVPAALRRRFDVVHVRCLTLVIKGGDPAPFLQNVLELLRPGGYIQWDEVAPSSVRAHAPAAGVSAERTTAFLRGWVGMNAKMGLEFDWVDKMGPLFEEHGLSEVSASHMKSPPATRKTWSDNVLFTFDMIGANILQKAPSLFGSKEEFAQLHRDAAKEAARGVTMEVDMWCVTGRRRTNQ